MPHPTTPLSRHLIAAALLLCTLCVSAAADILSEQLVVSGAVKTSLTLKVDDLKAYAPEQITSVTVTRRVGDKDTPSTVRGVKLTAVLDRAAFSGTGPNDWKHTVVLATATDGYQVVFSWPELFNTEIGSATLVVFERDGQPLGEREGRIALVSARDTRAGPRSVRWLTRLEVRTLKD